MNVEKTGRLLITAMITMLGRYFRTRYDISADWSRWPSRPISSLRYIIACRRI